MKNNILVNIIKGLIILSFLTPLFVSSSFIFPYVFPKAAAFQILVEIMFFLWLILMMGRPEYRPKKSRIFWAIALFLTIAFLASVFGASFSHSFWSNYERMTGLVSMLHYFAFFLVLTSVLKIKKDWLLIFDSFIAVSVLLSLFALGQKLDIKSFLMAGQGRLSATFGNPAYLAAYLLFALFFIVFMFFQRRSQSVRIYYVAVFIFNFLILIWTATRGAFLAFGMSIILFMLSLIFWPKENQEKEAVLKFRARLKKIGLAVLVLFIAFTALIFSAKNSSLVKNSSFLSRITTISLTETTSQTRLLAWKMSWKGFLERPILGWGWENYNIVFNKFYDPHLFPTESWFDRAHNIVFDTLIATGLVGFLSYLLIFGAAFLILWRALKQKKIDFLNAALFAILLIAYFAQDLFVFDMLYSYLPFFMVLAFIAWVGKDEHAKNASAPLGKPIKPNAFLWVILAAIFVFVLYTVNLAPGIASATAIDAMIKSQMASSYLQAANQDSANGQMYLKGVSDALDSMDQKFQQALNYSTFGRFEIRLQLFEAAKGLIGNYQNFSADKKIVDDFINFAISQGDKTVKEIPLDSRYLLAIGQLNLLYSQITQSKELVDNAAQVLEVAYKESQTKQVVIFALAEARVRQGRDQEAVDLLKKAIALNDGVFDPYWNLAQVYFSLGQKEDGFKELALIEQKFSGLTAEQNKRISDVLAQKGNYNEAINYLLKAINKNPSDADLYASLAGLYSQMGEKQKAKEAAQKAAQLDPELQSAVDQFIKSLGI